MWRDGLLLVAARRSRAANLAKSAMSRSKLPLAIDALLAAIGRRDPADLAATFAQDAVITDGRVEYRGEAIRDWIDRSVFGDGTATYPINTAQQSDGIVVTMITRWTGGDEISATQLDWRCIITDGKISALNVHQSSPQPKLPAPVSAFVLATNTFDLDALLETFSDDAIVNDQLREYRGKAAIKNWAIQDIVGIRVTMYVVGVTEHHGHAVITANADGDYDKGGLPDPLVLTLYFSLHGDKIIQLIILRNETVT